MDPNDLKQVLAFWGLVGGFVGGLLGQLLAGAVYLRKIVKHRCANHSMRLEALENVLMKRGS